MPAERRRAPPPADGHADRGVRDAVAFGIAREDLGRVERQARDVPLQQMHAASEVRRDQPGLLDEEALARAGEARDEHAAAVGGRVAEDPEELGAGCERYGEAITRDRRGARSARP